MQTVTRLAALLALAACKRPSPSPPPAPPPDASAVVGAASSAASSAAPPPAVTPFTDATPLGESPSRKEAGAEKCRFIPTGELAERLTVDPVDRNGKIAFRLTRTNDGALAAWTSESDGMTVVALDRTLRPRAPAQHYPNDGYSDLVGVGAAALLVGSTATELTAQGVRADDGAPLGALARTSLAGVGLEIGVHPFNAGSVFGRHDHDPLSLFWYAAPPDAPAAELRGGSPVVFGARLDNEGARIERTLLDFKWPAHRLKTPTSFAVDHGRWALLVVEDARSARVFTSTNEPFRIPLQNTVRLQVEVVLDGDEITATAATGWNGGCNQIVAGVDGKIHANKVYAASKPHAKEGDCPDVVPREPRVFGGLEVPREGTRFVRTLNGNPFGEPTAVGSGRPANGAAAWLGDRFGVVYTRKDGNELWSLQTAFIDCTP